MEDDSNVRPSTFCILAFQSTSPVWRTTFDGFAPSHFSGISIHVPRVEDDRCHSDITSDHIEFQSTSPVWRTTPVDDPRYVTIDISIHVPRVEDDFSNTSENIFITISIHVPRVEDDGRRGYSERFHFHFNPRPPCGGRQQYCTNRMQHHFTQTGCSAYFFFITSFSHRLYHFAAAVFPARMHRDFYVRFTFAESDYQRLGYVKR